MKKAFAIFCAVILMPGLNAQAWVGGPFSNNNPLPNGDDGIYEAVATMSNGTGIYRWAVRNQSARPAIGGAGGGGGAPQPIDSNINFGGLLNASSSNVWYYQGITYYGMAFGMVNSAAGIVTVVANATEITNLGSVNTVPVNTPAGVGAGIDVQIIPSSGGVGDTSSVLVTARPQDYPSTANSSFTAKLKRQVVSRFSGTGVIAFTRQSDAIRILTFSLGADADVTVDGANTTVGEADEFEPQGHQRKFKVFGTQVATAVLP